MSGKQALKAELEEELIEGASIQSNFAGNISLILDDLNIQESLDHENDKLRSEGIGFLLNSLEAYNAKDYEGMQKYLHAAIQKFHAQEALDFKDDKPRVDIRIKLSEARIKAIHNEEEIVKLIKKLGDKNACLAKK